MDKNTYKAKWKQLRGRTKLWQGKITRNRRESISGRIDLLAGKAQEQLGHLRNRASIRVDGRKGNSRSNLWHWKLGSKSK